MRDRALGFFAFSLFLGAVTFGGPSPASRSMAREEVNSRASSASVAVLTADVDRDGIPNWIAVDRAGSRGFVTVYRAIDRASLEGSHLEQVASEELDAAPDFAAAADLDGDAFTDVVVGTAGAYELTVLLGDERGTLGRRRSIPLGGALTAFAAGEANRADGLVDLVVGVEDALGASLLVLESPSGALEADGERIRLPSAARSISLGPLGGTSFRDIVASSDDELFLVPGRDRKLATPSADHGSAVLRHWPLEDRIVSLSMRRSEDDGRWELAGLGADGRVRVLRVPGPERDGEVRVLQTIVSADDRESLVTEATAAPFVVNSTGDGADAVPGNGVCADGSGQCTLRAAIQEANAAAGADTITFSLGTGTPTVAPLTALPAITAPVTIRGNTGGATRIQINGASAGAGSNGFQLAAGSAGSLLRSFVINRFTGTGAGIRIESGSNTVEDCWIGLDTFGGGSVAGNAGGGIVVSGASATSNLIGGAAAGARNTISHNGGNGIQIDSGASSNRVEGNYIGTNPGANIASGNAGDGIAVLGAAKFNTIGAGVTSPGSPPGNVISGNSGDGVDLSGSATNGNLVQGNLIGTTGAGTTGLGNTQNGVIVQAGASNNTIGGTAASLRNVISGNNFATSDGIELNGAGLTGTNVFGNYIGLDLAGSTAVSNGEDGILVWQGSQNNTIGAAAATPGTAGGNVISGNNRNGVRIEGSSTSGMLLQGNIIGLRASGSAAVRNVADGISIDAATGTTIGGTTATQRNVISGNDGASSRGIVVASGANSTIVQGNYIGTDITGVFDLGNGAQGVFFNDPSAAGIAGIVVGGLTSVPGTVPGNVISGNGGSGIEISGSVIAAGTIQGNIIGLNASGSAALGNDTGVAVSSTAHGILIGGTSTTARNVISGNTTGIRTSVFAGTSATVQGNYIGTNIGGSVAIGNVMGIVTGRSVTIGGVSVPLGAPPGNLISGNGTGISIQFADGGRDNTVRGNIIGATPDGLTALPNGTGVSLGVFVHDNTVGGTAAGERNLISGNTSYGVSCGNCATNSLIGNWIGVSLSGTSALPNGVGVAYDGATFSAPSLLITGGTTAGSGNVISGNLGAGILFDEIDSGSSAGIFGNLIGVAPDGVTPMGNGSHGIAVTAATPPSIGGTVGLTPGACTGACNVIRFNHGDGISYPALQASVSIRGNRISDNDGLGIDLAADGVTQNEPGETARPTNFPVVTSAFFDGTNTTIQGSLSSTASATFAIDVFRGATDPSGYGEGDVYLGTVPCSTDTSGNGVWSLVIAGSASSLTATATSPQNATSEFALNFVDADSDSYADASDNCPTVFNPGQIDQDFDGRGDDCDCAPADGGSSAIPAEVMGGPTATSKTSFQWTAVPNAGSATVYDVLRGETAALPVDGGATETCVGSFSGTMATDATNPTAGRAFWYVVRARNSCGASTYGFASGGGERVSGVCP